MKSAVEGARRGDYPAAAMTKTFSLAALLMLSATPALAQMYPGQGITVNPAAIGSPYPYGSHYSTGPQVIHLHMPAPPRHHHHVAAKPKPATSAVATTAPAPAPATPDSGAFYATPLDSLSANPPPAPAPAPPAKHPHKEAAASPPEQSAGQDAALPLALDPSAPRPVTTPHRHSANAANPAKVASTDNGATTAVVATHDASAQNGLSKRTEILFPRGEPDVSAATVNKMRAVAADLNTLLGAGAQRVQLDAYGGARGDKGSDARRLSLKRALGIRQLLIEDGVPSEKIDVRAMGGIDDSGAPDRVDVFVRTG